MAAAFAQYHAGDRIEALTGGSGPAETVDPAMQDVMAEKKIDMGFRFPRSIQEAVAEAEPDLLVAMGCDDPGLEGASAERIDWNLSGPGGSGLDAMRRVRDEVEKKVLDLIDSQNV
jgi:protein-tyrosine-phosphatase